MKQRKEQEKQEKLKGARKKLAMLRKLVKARDALNVEGMTDEDIGRALEGLRIPWWK
jgi:hypothetical protein